MFVFVCISFEFGKEKNKKFVRTTLFYDSLYEKKSFINLFLHIWYAYMGETSIIILPTINNFHKKKNILYAILFCERIFVFEFIFLFLQIFQLSHYFRVKNITSFTIFNCLVILLILHSTRYKANINICFRQKHSVFRCFILYLFQRIDRLVYWYFHHSNDAV